MDFSSGGRLEKNARVMKLNRGLFELPPLGKKPAGGLEPWAFRAAAVWKKRPRGDLNRGLFRAAAAWGKKRPRGDLNRGLSRAAAAEGKSSALSFPILRN